MCLPSFTRHGSLIFIIINFFEFQVRIREIPVLDKLKYLHCLLSSVLPVVKQIHHEQASEVELQKKLNGKMSFVHAPSYI